MEIFQGIFDSGSIVTPLETVCYMLLVTFFTLMRLAESCLVNTFSFAYYWGFKSLLSTLSTSSVVSENTIVIYTVSGLVIFGLLHLSYLRKHLFTQRAKSSKSSDYSEPDSFGTMSEAE
ncbi:MAG: hypothetical protein IH796_02775 [Deltaproteobacteria bacterium]|nr:hypothetical protein [Deltaproteobacteria bacterium]